MSSATSSFIDFKSHGTAIKWEDYIKYNDCRKEMEKYKSFWNTVCDVELRKDYNNNYILSRSSDIFENVWIEVDSLKEEYTIRELFNLFKNIQILGNGDSLIDFCPVSLDFIYNFMSDNEKKVYENLAENGCLLLPCDLVLPMQDLPYANLEIKIDTNVETNVNVYAKYTTLPDETRFKMRHARERTNNMRYLSYPTVIVDVDNLSTFYTPLKFKGFTNELMYAIRDKDTLEYIPKLIHTSTLRYSNSERFRMNSLQSSILNPSLYKKTIGPYEIHLISLGSNIGSCTDFSRLAEIGLQIEFNSKEVTKYFLKKLVMIGLTNKNLFGGILMCSEVLRDIFNFLPCNGSTEIKSLELCVVQVKTNLIACGQGCIAFPYYY